MTNLFGDLFDDIFRTFRIVIEFGFQEIWEEKQPQDSKHNEQLEADDKP